MKQIYFCCYLLLGSFSFLSAQVGIGTTTPDASAALDITSTTTGMLIPTMSSAQRTGISPAATAEGLLVYQTNGTSGFYYWDGAAWQTFGGGGSGWALTGDGSTTAGTNFVGTTDGQGLSVRTAGAERMRVSPAGLVGIGIAAPTEELHIVGASPVFRFQDGNETANYVLTSDANGEASWNVYGSGGGSDDDWAFLSGTGLADPIYHAGGVVIGRTGTTTHHLDVDNNAGTTTIGVGNNEFFQEGNNEVRVSHSIMPISDSSFGFAYEDLGSPLPAAGLGLRWNTVYTVNAARLAYNPKITKKIQPISYGVNEVMKLNPVSYNWKEEKVGALVVPAAERELKLGFIAQEVHKVLPELVQTESWTTEGEGKSMTYVLKKNKHFAVNYDGFLPVLIKAKQEQDKRIQALQVRYNKLQSKVLQLTKKQ